MSASAAIALAVCCPLCDDAPATVFRTRDEIAAELAIRDAFFARRRVRDLTVVLLGTPADILRCDACGILIRDHAPDENAFRDDRYDTAVLQSLHAVHAAAFREKDALLPPGARIVEIGSYAGGFLTVARERGWTAIGVDIGRDTSRFTRALGFDVRSVPLEACGFDSESFDGVFVWNCFEQLPDPRGALAEAHRILRRSGILVLRVPDAAFYAECRSLAALAYNGLLGWPHRFGFSAAALCRLAAEHRFALRRVQRAPAISPLPEAAKTFGWLEATFRKR
ncbi:MAG TPA: class I SAM-dependent methyltransferase [Thermoanaerobaculia bacterium]|nr:class I SAM-dependent methyltransferase [Thermoanaerobaculia bacterium]